LFRVLVFDFPNSISNVKPENIQNWGKKEEDLLEIGLENIKQKYSLEAVEQELLDFKIWALETEHFFSSNIILEKERLKKYLGSKGALVGMPTRHVTMIYPINDSEAMKIISPLIFVIKGIFTDGPGSLSESLYWYKDGKLTTLPYTLKKKKIDFFPPDEFIKTLA